MWSQAFDTRGQASASAIFGRYASKHGMASAMQSRARFSVMLAPELKALAHAQKAALRQAAEQLVSCPAILKSTAS